MPGRDLLAQRLAERPDPVLRRVIDGVAAAGYPAGHGADVDHVGNLPRAVFRRADQVRQGSLRAVHQAEQVDLDHPPPLVRRRALDRSQQHHPGVVDQRVQPPQLGHCPLDQPARFLLAGDIRREHHGDPAVAADPRR